jgi:hypothetical protein
MSQPSSHQPVKRDIDSRRFCAVCGVRWPCMARQQEIIAEMKGAQAHAAR